MQGGAGAGGRAGCNTEGRIRLPGMSRSQGKGREQKEDPPTQEGGRPACGLACQRRRRGSKNPPSASVQESAHLAYKARLALPLDKLVRLPCLMLSRDRYPHVTNRRTYHFSHSAMLSLWLLALLFHFIV